jgi:hypothetical protein
MSNLRSSIGLDGRTSGAGAAGPGCLSYCLHVTLRARLSPLAPGLTPRAVLDKFAAIQTLDVHLPTTDGRTLILSRYTELTADLFLSLRLYARFGECFLHPFCPN